MRIKIGVSDPKALKSPSFCFGLGKEATRVLDALAFAEFYFRPEVAKGGLKKRELGHISTGVFSSATSAKALAFNVEGELKAKVERYEKQARSLNSKIRTKWVFSSKRTTPTSKDVAHVERSLKELRRQASEIWDDVHSLCTFVPRRTIKGG